MSKSHQQVVEDFSNGKTRSTGSNVFVEGDTIYSYGHHFPLAIRQKKGGFIVNGDRYSSTTSGHTSLCIRNLQPNVQIPFSSLEVMMLSKHKTCGWHEEIRDNLEIEDQTSDQTRTLIRMNPKTKEPEEYEEHLLGSVLFQWNGFCFLSSTDTGAKNWGQGYFLVELPEKVSSVKEAFESLMPEKLVGKNNYVRQGEFFFVPMEIPKKKRISITKVLSLPKDEAEKIVSQGRTLKQQNLAFLIGQNDSGNPHVATELRRFNGGFVVRGTVRHPEHKMLKLGRIWHFVFRNRAVNSWSSLGRVD